MPARRASKPAAARTLTPGHLSYPHAGFDAVEVEARLGRIVHVAVLARRWKRSIRHARLDPRRSHCVRPQRRGAAVQPRLPGTIGNTKPAACRSRRERSNAVMHVRHGYVLFLLRS
jgi:hypothetical protein